MIRKTDDNVILQMLNDDKTQKEIAEHFGVSPAAICKRVRKINSALRAEKSLEGLTDKQKDFALAIAEGKTQTQAALDSHECGSLTSAKSMGYQLMQDPDIQKAVAELMQEEGLTRRYRVQKLKGHVDSVDPGISLRALDQTWKLDGAYSEEHVHVHLTYEQMVQRDAELKAEIEKIMAEYDISPEIFEGKVIEEDGDD